MFLSLSGHPVDAAGKSVHVVDDVSADESLRVLEGVIGQTERHRGRNGALNAIAMHDSPQATQERLKTAGFWERSST